MNEMTKEQRDALHHAVVEAINAHLSGYLAADCTEHAAHVIAAAGFELRPIAPEPAGEVGDLVAALEKIGARGDGSTSGDDHQRCHQLPDLAAYTARKGGDHG